MTTYYSLDIVEKLAVIASPAFCYNLILIYFIFQLKNAFDNLFEDLMESKDGEKEAAKVPAV